MEALVILAGIGVAGVGFYLLGQQGTQRPVAIGLAAAGIVIAGATAISMSDDDDGGNEGTSDVAAEGTTSETTAPADTTTTSEFEPGTTEPSGESGPENISIIPDCFDQHYQDEPEVTSDMYRGVLDEDGSRTSDWVPSGRPAALFVIVNDEVIGSVRFEYSNQDTLTIHDAVDELCEPVPWEQTGTELRSSTIAAEFGEGEQYEIVFDFPDDTTDQTARRATIHHLESE